MILNNPAFEIYVGIIAAYTVIKVGHLHIKNLKIVEEINHYYN